MKDQLSGCNEDKDGSQSRSILYCFSGKHGPAAGTDENMSDKGPLLFEKENNLEEMRSAEDIPHNQLEITDQIKSKILLDQRSYQDQDNKLDVQFNESPQMKFLEMTSLVDSGGVDCFGSGVEIETLEKEPVDQNWSGSDFQNTNPGSNAFI